MASFGKTVGTVICVLALWRLYRHGFAPLCWGWFAFGDLMILLGMWRPQLLEPLYRPWMKLAEVLGRINSTIILVVAYVLVMVPFGVGMRLFGRDPMRRQKQDSYWLSAAPNPRGIKHFENQF
jgi:hypothetical protein